MENLLNPEITAVLGWTLLHSIWQGVLLAILYFCMSKFINSAEVKYQFGIGLMFTQFVVAIGTLIYIVDYSIDYEVVSLVVSQKLKIYLSTYHNLQKEVDFIDTFQTFCNSNLPLFVQIWLVGVTLFFIKFLFDVWAVNRLKNDNLKPVDNQTINKFNELISTLKIAKKIEIFESSQTSSPIVIGNLKPFILLPIGLASGLTIKELEAILAHELAHIKRNDFLINILQTIIEIIFFFSPAIWWISSQVRQEREHCCDDFSVSITGDKMLLVSALAHVETFRTNQSLAMAFGKKRMSLLHRISRILGVNNKENRSVESIVIIFFVSTIIASFIVFKSENVVGQIEFSTEMIRNSYGKDQMAKEDVKIVKVDKIKSDFSEKIILEDTTIVEKESIKYENKTIEEYNNQHKYINSFTKNGNFWINRVGEIYVNGQKYNASQELTENLKPFLKKLDQLNDEMQVYSKKMDVLGKEMKVYGDKMEEKSKPMQILGKLMEAQGKLLEQQVKLQTKYSLLASLSDLENEKSEKASNEKLEKEHEKKVNEISKEMDKLGKEMEKLGQGMEENGKPMEEIGKKMEVEGKQMEIIGNKMEVVSMEMIKLLPDDLKKKIKEIERGFKE